MSSCKAKTRVAKNHDFLKSKNKIFYLNQISLIFKNLYFSPTIYQIFETGLLNHASAVSDYTLAE